MDLVNQHLNAWISLAISTDYALCALMAFGSLNRSEVNIVQVVVIFIPVGFPSPTVSSTYTSHLTQSVQPDSTRPESDAVARAISSTHIFEIPTHVCELLLGERVGAGVYICVL
jgi:hypothetical protein